MIAIDGVATFDTNFFSFIVVGINIFFTFNPYLNLTTIIKK
jgi:hypothetical protein